MRHSLKHAHFFLVFLCLAFCAQLKGQAALLLEQPYGFFGALNPTGHAAIYLARICADTPTKLRRCKPDELGSVISRYQGLDDNDWLAIPLVPYLYAVEDSSEVPLTVDKASVNHLRDQFYERHLLTLGADLPRGGFFRGGWSELAGASYERRIYAYRFNTSVEQDNELIAYLNGHPNVSRFNLLYQNCADFSRTIMNFYLPGVFDRSLFPDAGLTTPKQITYKLMRYARSHPGLELKVYLIPQVPGYRKQSRRNHGIAESFVTTGYAIPLVALNPYLAGGLFVDYLIRGRAHLVPKDPILADAMHIDSLTGGTNLEENPIKAEALNTAANMAGKANP